MRGMLGQAQSAGKPATSLLQFVHDDSPEEVEARLEKLGPIMDRLKSLDPRAFGSLSSLVTKVQAGASASPQQEPHDSFLQRDGGDKPVVPESEPDTSRKLEALQPVLLKLKALDGKIFGLLSNMMAQAAASRS